ncbi:MAG: Glycerophosphoryl diester phosphodiesterase, partial [uncultured Nocardioides sp.]
ETAGRRPPGEQPRHRRAHAGGVREGRRRRGGRPRVRRPAHRRRPPRVRARPRPAPYGGDEGRRLHDEPRRARRAGLRVLEEPLGRARRRGARDGPRGGPGPDAAQAPGDGRRPRPPDRGGDRDQAPHPLRRTRRAPARRAARRLRVDRCRLAGAGDELLVQRGVPRATAGPRHPGGDAGGQGPPLAGAASAGGGRLDHRSGHEGAARAPGAGPAPGQGRARDPRLGRQQRGRPRPLPRAGCHGRDQRPPGPHPGAARPL